MRWLVRVVIAAAAFLLLIVLVFAAVGRSNPKYGSILQDLLPLVFLALLWIAVLMGMPRYVGRKQAMSAPWAQGTLEMATSETGVRMHSQHSDSNLAWSAFVRWMETKTGFVLYMSPYMFWIVPKSAMSAGDLAEFREILGAHISIH